MKSKEDKIEKRSEYTKFKKNEPTYIASLTNTGTKKKKDWVWWLVALVVVSTSTYFVVDRMLDSRVEMTEVAKIDKLSAEEAVHQMFDKDDKQWIRKDLRQAEYDQVHQKVEDLNDSAEKAKIRSLLATAGEQLDSQLEGLSYIEKLKTKSGDINVDLKEKDLVKDMDKYPRNYNPDYVEELKAEYTKTVNVIKKAIALEKDIQALTVEMDKGLNKDTLDTYNNQVEKLPYSDRKSRLTNDMKALYKEYDRQVEEYKKQVAEEKRRQAEEAKQAEIRRQEEEERRHEEEQIRKIEQERQAEIDRQAREQAEWEAEQKRQAEEELRQQEELRKQEEAQQNTPQPTVPDSSNQNNNNNNNNNTGTTEEGSTPTQDSGSTQDSESTNQGSTAPTGSDSVAPQSEGNQE